MIRCKDKATRFEIFRFFLFLMFYFFVPLNLLAQDQNTEGQNDELKDYCIAYGSVDGQVKVVDYFSLSCPKCRKFFLNDFANIIKEHGQDLHWVFHPVPFDQVTLEFLVCIENSGQIQRQLLLKKLFSLKSDKERSDYMKEFMAQPTLDTLDYLKTTNAYQKAAAFYHSTDIEKLPLIEINGNRLQSHRKIKELIKAKTLTRGNEK